MVHHMSQCALAIIKGNITFTMIIWYSICYIASYVLMCFSYYKKQYPGISFTMIILLNRICMHVCMWISFAFQKVREAKMSVDARGNMRGRCQKQDCYCDAFIREGSKIRCAYCDHTPGDHELVSGASASDSASGYASFNVSESAWTPAASEEPDDRAMEKVVARMGDITIGELKSAPLISFCVTPVSPPSISTSLHPESLSLPLCSFLPFCLCSNLPSFFLICSIVWTIFLIRSACKCRSIVFLLFLFFFSPFFFLFRPPVR